MEGIKVEDEDYEIVTAAEVQIAQEDELQTKMQEQDKQMEAVMDRLEEEGVVGMGEEDLREIVQELRHLEEKLHMWREVGSLLPWCFQHEKSREKLDCNQTSL